jgi:hypothetical protein
MKAARKLRENSRKARIRLFKEGVRDNIKFISKQIVKSSNKGKYQTSVIIQKGEVVTIAFIKYEAELSYAGYQVSCTEDGVEAGFVRLTVIW